MSEDWVWACLGAQVRGQQVKTLSYRNNEHIVIETFSSSLYKLAIWVLTKVMNIEKKVWLTSFMANKPSDRPIRYVRMDTIKKN